MRIALVCVQSTYLQFLVPAHNNAERVYKARWGSVQEALASRNPESEVGISANIFTALFFQVRWNAEPEIN